MPAPVVALTVVALPLALAVGPPLAPLPELESESDSEVASELPPLQAARA